MAGEESQESDKTTSDEGSFTLRLAFAAEACPGCGLVASAGSCPKCGSEIPAPTELAEPTQVRREVLLPLRKTAEGLFVGFDNLGRGTIPITASAMLSGFVEASLFSQALEVTKLGQELEHLDLDDPSVIRGPVCELFDDRLTAVGRALSSCQELAAFSPEPPGDQLQTIAFELGRKAARLLVAFLAALSAVDAQAASDAQEVIQEELKGYADQDELARLLDRLADSPTGVDARLGHALARPGLYSDPFGTVDLGRVFGAFSESGSPFRAIGRRAAQYFSFVLDTELSPHQYDTAAALLSIPLVEVVSAARPLTAHRLARLTYDLMHEAAQIDRDGVADVVDAATTESGNVFGALARIHEAFAAIESLAGENPDGARELELAAAQLLDQVIESSWRLQAQVLQQLDDVRNGRRLTAVDPNRSFEAIQAQLADARSPALREFARSVARIGHSPSTETPDSRHHEMEDAASALFAAMAGVDAGYCLGIVAETLSIRTPQWIQTGDAAYAIELVARMLFGAAGAEVRQMSADGARVVVAPLASHRVLDATRLLTAVAGLRGAAVGTDRFSITDEAGTVLVEVDAKSLRAAEAGPELTRDLAVVECFYYALIARGDTLEAVVVRLAATQLVATLLPAMQEFAATPWDIDVYTRVATRLKHVSDFIRRHHVAARTVRRLGERVARASASASMASHGDQAAGARLRQQVPGLAAWAAAHNDWPLL